MIKIGDWVRFEYFDKANSIYEIRIGVVQYIVLGDGVITDRGFVLEGDILEIRRELVNKDD